MSNKTDSRISVPSSSFLDGVTSEEKINTQNLSDALTATKTECITSLNDDASSYSNDDYCTNSITVATSLPSLSKSVTSCDDSCSNAELEAEIPTTPILTAVDSTNQEYFETAAEGSTQKEIILEYARATGVHSNHPNSLSVSTSPPSPSKSDISLDDSSTMSKIEDAISPLPTSTLDDAVNEERTEMVENDDSQPKTALDYARKTGVAVAGGSLVAVGAVLIPLPIPAGCIVVGVGMAVLGKEFPAAQGVLDSAKDGLVNAKDGLINVLEKEDDKDEESKKEFNDTNSGGESDSCDTSALTHHQRVQKVYKQSMTNARTIGRQTVLPILKLIPHSPKATIESTVNEEVPGEINVNDDEKDLKTIDVSSQPQNERRLNQGWLKFPKQMGDITQSLMKTVENAVENVTLTSTSKMGEFQNSYLERNITNDNSLSAEEDKFVGVQMNDAMRKALDQKR